MTPISERLKALSPEQRALLMKRLNDQSTVQAKPNTVIPKLKLDPGDMIPLSLGQQRLWFLSQFQEESTTYNIPFALRLEGKLDTENLIAALNQIVQRHGTLRTQFELSLRTPHQVILPSIEIPLTQLDWQSVEAQAIPSKLKTLYQSEFETVFPLNQAPLFRVVLVQVSPTCHYLILTFHHILTDAWSMGSFLQELMTLYKNPQSSLPPLVIQYADYAAWQRNWAQGEAAQTQLKYWQEQLKDLPPVLSLPTDNPRPPQQTNRGKTLKQTLSGELLHQLKALSGQTQTTLFMVLELAFAMLMARFSRQKDIAIGTPISNRSHLELEPLIGFFVNTLVLRNTLQENLTVEEMLEQTKSMVLDAFQHQDIAFEALVEQLQPVRTLSHTPLFQVLFSLQNTPVPQVNLPNLSLYPCELELKTAKFDLSLLMEEGENQLFAAWEYNTDLFTDETIECFMDCFQTLLQGMVQHPKTPICQLPLLSPAHFQRQVYDWNQTTYDFSDAPSGLLHGGIEAQAAKIPEAIALLYNDQTVTFATLNQRANQYAHALQALGVGAETLVGVCVERSPEMVIAVLAVLKAGGAYVPLDPSYPDARLVDILADAKPKVVLTQTEMIARLPEMESEIIDLNQSEAVAHYSTENLTLDTSPDQLAYLIYTSGSTGKPKGVMISHRGAVNTNLDINQRFKIDAQDCGIGLASLSFDLSVYDIFGLLAAGAKLLIPRHADTLNPARWLDLMHHHQVSFWNTAPAVMEMLMTYVSGQSLSLPSTLRVVMMSGDAISVTLPDLIRSHAQPNIEVYSLGGATEGSIWSICYPIETVSPDWTSIPYGRPLLNQRFHILDEYLNPVPVGVTGELLIGGDGVALGYFNRPDLTAQRFIADPFFPGDRLYRTGDLGCYQADGTILFMGRVDHQVKIRGFRIELGDIEAAIQQQPEIQEVTLLVHEDRPQQKQLCAYVVPKNNQTVDLAMLKQVLRQKLPDYMVPSHIVVLKEFPLTSNGKVDRKSLPRPQSNPPQHSPSNLPQSDLEKTIAQVWAESLHINTVGLEDNFFDLGGHSLLMVEVQLKLEQALDQSINIVDLFQYPTVATLAKALQKQKTIQDQGPALFDLSDDSLDNLSPAERRRALRHKLR